MNWKKTILSVLLCSAIISHSFAQKQKLKIDSLISVISSEKRDTTRITLLNSLSGVYIKSSPDSSLYYANKALQQSAKIKWRQGIAGSLYSMGVAYKTLGALDSALIYQQQASAMFIELHDTTNLIKVLINTGLIYNTMGNYPHALENYYSGLRMAEAQYDSVSISKALLNIGLTHYHEKNYDKALLQYDKALRIQQRLNDKNSIGVILLNQGLIYARLEKKQLALDCYQKALENFKEVENKVNVATTLSNIGTLYVEMHNYSSALEYQWEALSMFEIIKDKSGIARSYSNIAQSYQMITQDTLATTLPDSLADKKKLLQTASTFLQQSIDIKRQTNELNGLQNAYAALSKVNESLGNFPAALENLKQHILIKDSVFNMESKEKIANLEAKRETELKEKEIQIQKLELAAMEKQKIYYIGLIILIILLSVVFVYRYKLRQTLNLVKLRTRIASDLHDDVSSTLSSISMSSNIIQKKLNGNATEVSKLLNQIGTNADAVMESMSDIVWTINTDNDRFDNVINRMRAFAVEILEPKDCAVHFQVAEGLSKVGLNMEQRKNLYLIFKEAIHNAAKYANCKNVWVTLELNDKKIKMVVKDDGVGFEKDVTSNGQSKGGNGITNMHKRSTQLHGTLSLQSQRGDGTRMVLEFSPQNSL